MKTIRFNRSIYSSEALQRTIAAFKRHAFITIKFRENVALVTFWFCRYGESQTIKEFENYLIGIENS